ncbi:hypothetical protein V8E55_006121 [Tylopilus felleus]
MRRTGIQDLPPIALDKKRIACRYYQTGNCRRGPNCPFAHISIAAQVETPTIPHPPYMTGEHMYAYYPVGQAPVYHPLDSRPHPVFLWQPYAPPSSSFDPRYGLVCQTENLSDHPDDKSDPSSAESPSTATSLDYHLRMTLDTPWLEGIESGVIQGVGSPPGDVGTNLSPGYAGYSYPGFPGVETECVVGTERATSGQYLDQGSMVAVPTPFALPGRDDPKKKPFAYKTKQCKFYATNGACTSGEKCTFIHDPEAEGNAKKPPPTLALPSDAKLPPKPLDKFEDYRAKDFYPITWRVIGGGVMMGGQRQICPAFAAGQCRYGNDCKFAHETELKTDEVGFIEPKSELPRKGEASPQQQTKGTTAKRVRPGSQRKSTKVPPPASLQPIIFPPATPRPRRPNVPTLEGIEAARKKGDQMVVLSAPPSPMHRRAQSLSMVGTSPDTTHPNYAAEL